MLSPVGSYMQKELVDEKKIYMFFFMGVKYHLSKVRLQAIVFIIVLTKASSEMVEVVCFYCTIGSSEC